MAERNPQVPHSIQSLLYVERNGNFCGYKPGLITDGINEEWEQFLICSECKGICRRARQERGNTVCEMCITGPACNLDQRVEHKVASLSSKCSLSGNGCCWKGKLREIERHMHKCDKLSIECSLKCGSVFRRETINQHSRVECQLRMVGCEFCEQRVKAREVNEHTRKCQLNPDAEVSCPYKELGCDVIILRKNKDIHLTENMTGHQKLVLGQLNQLRNRELANRGRRKGVLWVMVTAVIAIAAAVAVAQFIDIRSKLQETESSLAETKHSLAETKDSLAETKDSLAETKDSLAETKSSLAEIKADLGVAITDSEETNKLRSDLLVANNRLQQMQQKLEFVEDSLQGHCSKFNKTQSSIKSLEQLVADINLEIITFRKDSVFWTGRLEWKIKGVKQKIENKEFTFSDPFYVGLYKCQGMILWDYDNSGEVGCFICIMKGAYDDKLKWPFIYRYKFVLLNQNENEDDYIWTDQVTKEDLHKFSLCFQRPTEERNRGFGKRSFISLSDLLTDKYYKDDSISLHITMEQLPSF